MFGGITTHNQSDSAGEARYNHAYWIMGLILTALGIAFLSSVLNPNPKTGPCSSTEIEAQSSILSGLLFGGAIVAFGLLFIGVLAYKVRWRRDHVTYRSLWGRKYTNNIYDIISLSYCHYEGAWENHKLYKAEFESTPPLYFRSEMKGARILESKLISALIEKDHFNVEQMSYWRQLGFPKITLLPGLNLDKGSLRYIYTFALLAFFLFYHMKNLLGS